jgi:hypothetical protein
MPHSPPPMARRRHILQIFNRYLQYGGEEGSVYRIGDALQEIHDVEYFISSTAEMISSGALGSTTVPFKAVYNREIDIKLTQYQQTGNFDAWMIHNIFPSCRRSFTTGPWSGTCPSFIIFIITAFPV